MGSALTFIDVTTIGSLYNPKNHSVWSGVRESAIDDIRLMQLDGPYILGGRDSKYLDNFQQEDEIVDSYCIFDTRSGKRVDFTTFNKLAEAARRLKI